MGFGNYFNGKRLRDNCCGGELQIRFCEGSESTLMQPSIREEEEEVGRPQTNI
jgi:hypothetical protein